MKRILLFSFLILYSCSPTLYRPGSYTDTKIGEDMYRVRFNGNQRTGGDYAQDMALLRSADLTISKGFEYFEIVDSDNQTITRTDLLFLPLGPMMTNSNSPKTMYTIILKDKKGESSYDANYIVSTFCRKYKPFFQN